MLGWCYYPYGPIWTKLQEPELSNSLPVAQWATGLTSIFPGWVLLSHVSMADSQGSIQYGNRSPNAKGRELFHFHSALHGPTNVRKMPTENIALEMKIGAKNGEMSNYFVFTPWTNTKCKCIYLKVWCGWRTSTSNAPPKIGSIEGTSNCLHAMAIFWLDSKI